MSRPIAATIRIESLGGVRKNLELSNTLFKSTVGDLALWAWLSNAGSTSYPVTGGQSGVGIHSWPWPAHPLFRNGVPYTQDSWVRHGATQGDNYGGYKHSMFSSNYNINLRERLDLGRMRAFNVSGIGSVSSDVPFVVGSLLLSHNFYRAWDVGMAGNAIAYVDLPFSQIGIPYQHPVTSLTLSTTAGASYVALASGNTSYWLMYQHLYSILRIESGSDRGQYIIQHLDLQSSPNRAYLRNMDGTKFVAQATAASVTASMGYRSAFFNETGVIPNSIGQVALSGRFDSGEARNSYIFRIHYDKGGSPSPSDEAQRGSYWVSARGYLCGHGVIGDVNQQDNGSPLTQRTHLSSISGYTGFLANTSSVVNANSEVCSVVLDRSLQRLWVASVDYTTGKGSLGFWNYKSPEIFREVVTAAGYTPYQPTSPAFSFPGTSAGAPYHIDIGSDGTLYVTYWSQPNDPLYSGVMAIKQDLTQTNFTSASVGVTSGGLMWCPVDRSRARSGTAGDASTTAAGHVISASGAFASSDIGRCIKVTGTSSDNGTYLISAINSTTDVTVTLLNGSAVAFTGGSGGTFQIGDRIYLFVYTDTAWNSGKMSWTDSLAFGTRFTQLVSMTAGAVVAARNYIGTGDQVSLDQLTGRVFWHSTDVARRVNVYDPSTRTVTQRLFTDFAVQVSGSNANPAAPSEIHSLAVNPNKYFRELWVATDQGSYRFNADDLSAQFSRYYGQQNTASTYAEADGLLQTQGAPSDANYGVQWVFNYQFLPDGQVYVMALPQSWNSGYYANIYKYNREADNWTSLSEIVSDRPHSISNQLAIAYFAGSSPWGGYMPFYYIDPYGTLLILRWNMKNRSLAPDNNNSSPYCPLLLSYPSAIHYQWIGGEWVAKEVVRGALPTATHSPGCLTKPLHTGFESLPFGVRVKFTSSGAVGGENQEFLGRCCQRGTNRSDGATSSGTANFTGSGFASLSFQTSDVGRYYVAILSGADQGVYRIASVLSDTNITLQKSNGVAFAATATTGTLQYSVWDLQSGTAIGPETTSFLANHGFGRDNTQDVSGIYADYFLAKALLSEQEESHKFCMDILPPMGSAGIKVYKEYPAATWNVALGGHLALPGSTYIDHVVDGGVARFLDGGGNKANYTTPTANNYWGSYVLSHAAGLAVTVDFGMDVEIGSIVSRLSCTGTDTPGSPWLFLSPTLSGGSIVDIYKASDAGGTPAATSTVRCAGTSNLSTTVNNSQLTLSSGDFFGSSIGVSGTDGIINPTTLGTNVFQTAAGTFSSNHLGMFLKLTTGPDIGTYRIIGVSTDGSQVTIRNPDRTAKSWSGAATGLYYAIHDGVREADALFCPTIASPSQGAYLIEYVSNDGTKAYCRITPATAYSNISWQCGKATWSLVKKLNTDPWITNYNDTFVSPDGKEDFGSHNKLTNANLYPQRSGKAVFGLSGLHSTQRTGRWWKYQIQGSGEYASGASYRPILDSLEFYDMSGKRLLLHKYCMPDSYFSQPQLLGVFYSRVDFIQASSSAASHISGVNGLASLGGASGDVVTLTNSNSFLGYQVRPKGTTGSMTGGSGIFTIQVTDPAFSMTSDVGRFLKIHSGVNAGVYRISVVTSATQVTVVTPSAAAVTFSTDSSVTFSVHEGINTGTTNPDYIVFMPSGNAAGLTEFSILSISDDLKTITIGEPQFGSLLSQPWEIRRRAIEDRTTGAGLNASLSARLLYAEQFYPYQSGDVCQDSKGYLKFWAGDIGGQNLTAGVTLAATDRFQAATGIFTPDDVGRIILITSGSNKGPHRITAVNSPAEVSLVNHYTDGSVSFVGESSLTYTLLGERRYRMARYVTTMRS